MTGDRHKPLKTFMRWINNFDDGVERTTKKGHKRIPSLEDKRKERRWRRHYEKEDMDKALNDFAVWADEEVRFFAVPEFLVVPPYLRGKAIKFKCKGI